MNKRDSHLSTDSPLLDLAEDKLNYAPFASHLATTISRLGASDGLTIAIYGPWGSGKTTLLEFVLRYLDKLPEDEQLVVMRFNPWWFSGTEALVFHFFSELQKTMKVSKRFESIVSMLASMAELVSSVPSPVATAGGFFATKARKRLEKTVPQLKKEINEALGKQNAKLLVVIDDIDRLTADEIRQVFVLIKAVADFPNVVYLLAFDKGVVVKALNETQGIPGEAYLEKIVQLPLELPPPEKALVHSLLIDKLNIILEDPAKVFDKTHWGNVFNEGISHFIHTPRDAVRLTNALAVTYSAVIGEVNPIDFVAIETLRLFVPSVYDLIVYNTEMFISPSRTNDVANPARVFHDGWLSQVPSEDRETVKRLIIRLFPVLEGVWQNRFYVGGTYERQWRQQLRICSRTIAPIYFRLAIPQDSFSRVEMQAIVQMASNVHQFELKLKELAQVRVHTGQTRARIFLIRLEDFMDAEFMGDKASTIAHVLLDIGSELSQAEGEPRHIFDFGLDWQLLRNVQHTLFLLNEQERFELLRQIIPSSNSLYLLVNFIALLGRQLGQFEGDAYPVEEQQVSLGHYEELKTLTLTRLREAAREGEIFNVEHLSALLHRWQVLAGTESSEVKQWAAQVVEDNLSLVRFIEGFLGKQFEQVLTDSVATHTYGIQLNAISEFIDLGIVAEKIDRLPKDLSLTERQRTALDQFRVEYNSQKTIADTNNPPK